MNIVQFCKNCKHSSVKANEHPCQMCMKMGINKYAGKPLAYEVEDDRPATIEDYIVSIKFLMGIDERFTTEYGKEENNKTSKVD